MAIEGEDLSYINTRARIAVYDDLRSAPRIVDVEPAPTGQFIADIASRTYELSHGQGGKIPFSVINEIAENFIHAYFKECVVSILQGGNTIRFSDQGQGIEKKTLVLQPGYTSATSTMKQYIKGVGSGFPLVREYLEGTSGYLTIDDNATQGTVITITVAPPAPVVEQMEPPAPMPTVHLSEREAAILQELLHKGSIGPSDIHNALDISIATAYRELSKLEKMGLVEATSNGKRILSNAGLMFIKPA